MSWGLKEFHTSTHLYKIDTDFGAIGITLVIYICQRGKDCLLSPLPARATKNADARFGTIPVRN